MQGRKHAKYYESILQLRNPQFKVIELVEHGVKAENQEDIFISKRKKVANGMDFYLSSNSFAISLGRALYDKFGGELKISKKLFSQHRQTSRLLYRMTVLFRMAPFSPDDFILFNSRAFKITNVRKSIFAIDVESLRSVELNYKDVMRNAEKLKLVKVTISKIRPHLEVIHPETFQSVPVFPLDKNSGLVPGERAKFVFSEHRIWRII